MHTHHCLIGGRWVPAQDGRGIDMLCPSDGQAFARIAAGGSAEIDAAIAAAHAARDGAWGRLSATERGRLLSALGTLVARNAETLAATEARDTGKPLTQARADITAAARYFEFYGGAADKIHGDTLPFLPGYAVMTLHEPFGVTGHIIPWNYPSQMVGRTVAAALAMGNAVVLKPAEEACLAPLAIAALAQEAGFPDGALNVVTGTGAEAGAALAGHPGIGFLSFTGSPETGTLVQAAAARNHIGCTLELGGKSPQILFEDADIDAALPVLVAAIVQNGGQTCSAGARALIHRSIYDEVVAALAARFETLTAASHDADADLGALISARQRDRVARYLDAATAPCLARGRIAQDAPSGGFYVAPALYGPVPETDPLAQEEVFGPVLSCLPFADEAEAVRIANGTPYGLVAGIWTADGARQMRMARAVRAGQVFINGYGAGGGIELPFGGTGRSGHGREKGFIALEDFAQLKTVVLKHG
ncbi:MAG: aldehyde dehydrogenase family protein [Pseudomonadota bacterium]